MHLPTSCYYYCSEVSRTMFLSIAKLWVWTVCFTFRFSGVVAFQYLDLHQHYHRIACQQQQPPLQATSTPFDFSSPQEWDRFYKERQQQHDDDENENEQILDSVEVEWHESISLQDIADAVPQESTILMVGCGTSRLPQMVVEHPENAPKHMILLDTSQTCLDHLRGVYGDVSASGETVIEYLCGDATRLQDYFGLENGSVMFDMIIDKGLTDALLCSEGWDGPLERMFQQACSSMTPNTGQYLLISYRLPKTTREFLVEVGEKAGLKWKFDVDLSNSKEGEFQQSSSKSRCMVSLATKRSR